MSVSSVADFTFTIGSVVIAGVAARTAEDVNSFDITLPVALEGVMDSTTGVDGLDTGHGIVTNDIIDLHWLDPTTGDRKARRGYTVDTDAANAITFNEMPSPEGDPLPANDTVVYIAIQVVIDNQINITGDNLVMVGVGCNQICVADIRSSSTSLQVVKLNENGNWGWVSEGNDTNPFASATLAKIIATNGSLVVARLQVAFHYDK